MTATNRTDGILSAEFQKDASDEQFLQILNDSLINFESILAGNLDSTYTDLPNIYVCGAPRSGTTLFTQVIASHFSVQAINNLVAAFWKTPSVGLRLSRKILGESFSSSFESRYGRTSDVREPHEFGYFWAEQLGYSELVEPDESALDDVNWQKFHQVMLSMQAAARRPIVFKAFMAAYYAEQIVRVLPNSLFIWVKRDPVENAYSILKGRAEYAGSETAWLSVKPQKCIGMESAAPIRQVCAQVKYIDEALSKVWATVGSKNAISIDYEAFCQDPEATLKYVKKCIDGLWTGIGVSGNPIGGFRATSSAIPDAIRHQIESTFDSL